MQEIASILHFNDTATKDECGLEWSTIGSPSISKNNGKFGNSCLYLNGSSALIIPVASLGVNPIDEFTIDFWINHTQNSWQRFFCMGDGYEDYGRIGFKLGDFYRPWDGYKNHTAGVYMTENIASGSLEYYDDSNNVWKHIAIVKKNKNIMLFLNGKLMYSIANACQTYTLTGNFRIGCSTYQDNTNNVEFFTGYMDEFRICRKAMWTNDFVPNTKQYCLNYTLDDTNIEILGQK